MSSNKIEISVKDIPEIIKTLEEAEKEIEFERKSKNLFIDDLYKVCEISLKQDKEIERLHSIIKEVRELVQRYNILIGYYDGYDCYDGTHDTYSHDTVKEDILGILDKENI